MATKWGAFLSQAVAGVESRLDTILAESDDNETANESPSLQPAAASRASSSTRTNDRLQARLAKAMASKNMLATSPRSSSDVTGRSSTEEAPQAKTAQGTNAATAVTAEEGGASSDIKDERRSTSTTEKDAVGGEADETPLGREMEDLKARHQEEIQQYVERIDSLQSKLQYMSKNAAETAKNQASSASPGSADQKLAEKDERIALLMDEGQKLAAAEQQYRTTIKKLRSQIADKEKQSIHLSQARDKALADSDALRNRLSGNEDKEKQQEEVLKVASALQREIDSLKRDKRNKDETMRRLEQEARAEVEQVSAASADLLKKTLASEQEKQRLLEIKKASLEADLDSATEKARLDSIEWSEKLERALERGRAVEAELRGELKTMESKLESMRVTAEEATSSSGGEAQVKLLRQIETLQSQYASARENWQGIEASLLAKSTGLEKEKHEAQQRESEMRKRARDAASRCRKLEDELQDTQPALAGAQQELEVCREQLAALRISSKAIETTLEQTRAELEKEKRPANRELNVEAERRQWVDNVLGATGTKSHSRPVSPFPPIMRNFSPDMVGFPAPIRTSRRTPTPGSIPNSSSDRLVVEQRSPPAQPLPIMPLSAFEPPAGTPSSISPAIPEATLESDVADTAPSAPSSPRHPAQDMISVSTVAAGPSVQLVERMSAAIRRLEAEKVTAKEEMARVCAQRDEARGDIAGLMKELEEARSTAANVPELEKTVGELDERYQTTLELLGEKSELVEELKADVEDVKAMYRELVERAVR